MAVAETDKSVDLTSVETGDLLQAVADRYEQFGALLRDSDGNASYLWGGDPTVLVQMAEALKTQLYLKMFVPFPTAYNAQEAELPVPETAELVN